MLRLSYNVQVHAAAAWHVHAAVRQQLALCVITHAVEICSCEVATFNRVQNSSLMEAHEPLDGTYAVFVRRSA